MKNLKVFLGIFTFAIAIGTALASNSLLTYSGFRSLAQAGNPCSTYASIPDDCLTSNPGQQCTAIVGGQQNFLFASISQDQVSCINPVKRAN